MELYYGHRLIAQMSPIIILFFGIFMYNTFQVINNREHILQRITCLG